MLAILFQEKTKKNASFPKKCRKNASIIEKGLHWIPPTLTTTVGYVTEPLPKATNMCSGC